MREMIQEIRILDESGKSLFDLGDEYIVPLYQRAYAWEEKEIVQMLHDILDMKEQPDAKYYLGTLIVSHREGKYEVIDGQQRLTTLFLLLKCLEERGELSEVQSTLRFACRDSSNYTLRHLFHLADDGRVEESIRQGRDIIRAELCQSGGDGALLKEKLSRVLLYRIEVPEHTDLNRYFEIMNTRGEQLEQHDILKARLMECLGSEERDSFAIVWDACSDMTGYVQMHFTVKQRERLFGSSWNDLPDCVENGSLIPLLSLQKKASDTDTPVAFLEILENPMESEACTPGRESEDRVHFESIIEFPYFLLHTLKVYVSNLPRHGNANDIPLDDKKLSDTFRRVMESITNGKADRRQTFAREFIRCLLRTRFLFDKFIIKRDKNIRNRVSASEESDGVWSLQHLEARGAYSSKKAYYFKTPFRNKWEPGKTSVDEPNDCNRMLEACLRVSYTSPKVSHWITTLLIWLSENNYANLSNLREFEHQIEAIARGAVRRDFLEPCEREGAYRMGVNTPHIVFNYLDYLLWKRTREDFTFEFRSSVEHWYPQHPSNDSFARFDEEGGEGNVDRFGNLCIIARKVNSKFSNLSPMAKAKTYPQMIEKGSLKLRRMAQNIDDALWRQGACQAHEEEMLSLLKSACKKMKYEIKHTQQNATPLVVKALEELKRAGGGELVFAPGEYHFYRHGAHREFFAVCNNSEGEKAIVFPLIGMEDITVDGCGSVFVFHEVTFPFMISNSKNITLRNMTVDTGMSPLVEFRLRGFSDEGFYMDIDREKSPFYVENGGLNLMREGGLWEGRSHLLSLHAIGRHKVQYLATGGFSIDHTKLPAALMRCEASETPTGIYVRYLSDSPSTCRFGEETVTAIVDGGRTVDTVCIDRSCGVSISNITVARGIGMGVIGQLSTDITVDGFSTDITYHEGAHQTLTADALHFVNCDGALKITNCNISDTMDDAINVHGVYTVLTRVEKNTVFATLKHREQYGFNPYRENDRLTFIHPKTFDTVAEFRVERAAFAEGSNTQLVLEGAFVFGEAQVEVGMWIENPDRMPDLHLHGNVFSNFPHNRVSGGGNILIENNRFSSCHAALLCLDLAPFWYESGRVRHLVFRNNTLTNCDIVGNSAFIRIGIDGVANEVAPKIHEHIEIVGNRFLQIANGAICAAGVRELIIRDNYLEKEGESLIEIF